MTEKGSVLILMGSDSDWEVMQEAAKILKEFEVPYEMTLSSAHRSPERTKRLIHEAETRGVDVIIAGAGGAAHLAGVIAAETILPVIGVPISSSPLNGLDSLLSTVQMPSGIPVATVAIGKAGAKNAGILATQILARRSSDLAKRLLSYKKSLAEEVEAKGKRFHEKGHPG
ncbi:MAG: 5-(carboxyamino)imidazole ribonucleotide mutase [Nitrospirae bacterium]|nr:5-(carboxyamino)imidazole ribonucleotide mutase [Candidatus Manganitrophaceae bacterium]